MGPGSNKVSHSFFFTSADQIANFHYHDTKLMAVV
jgi:hypothetical protein